MSITRTTRRLTPKAKLTVLEERFVQHYLVHLNARQAALEAGYSENTAKFHSHKLLRRPAVKEAINNAMQERAARMQIQQDDVIRELARVALSTISTYVTWDEEQELRLKSSDAIPEEAMRAVQSLSASKGNISIRLVDKARALEMLGRHLGMFTDNLNLQGDALTSLLKEIAADGDDQK